MALTQRLEFRQNQLLVMTPQLMQAIKLLHLSNLDLSAFVEEELERNPLLSAPMTAPRRRWRAKTEPSPFSDAGGRRCRGWQPAKMAASILLAPPKVLSRARKSG
jgi:RNA polymerase sigma-54 factor